jgi:hypothetical protein
MIKTARLNINGKNATMENLSGMEETLKKVMRKCGVTMADIEVNAGSAYGSKTHFGNWCITPVLDNAASAKLAAAMKSKLDYQQQILEGADIAAFKSGDKVTVSFVSDFGFAANVTGKICRAFPPIDTPNYKCEGEIVILKERSRSKGWVFHPGDFVTIEKVQIPVAKRRAS